MSQEKGTPHTEIEISELEIARHDPKVHAFPEGSRAYGGRK